MKKIVFTFILPVMWLFFAFDTNAQTPVFSWNARWGNADSDFSPELATDPKGNVYCAGYFKGTVDFDPGPGQVLLTSGFGGFGNDSYIAKFDSAGAFQWVKQIDGASLARGIVYDTQGFLVIIGEFNAMADFNPGSAILNITPHNGSSDVYILTLDLDGNFVSVNTVGGNGQEYLGSMTTDSEGNIIVGGLFTGTSDFDPGPGQTIFTAGGLADLFIVKLDVLGNFIWAKEFSGNFQGDVSGLVTDTDDNIYVTGVFDDIRDFDPGPDSLILTATGYWDIYLVKLSSSGDLIWLQHLANSGDNYSQDLMIDEYNNLYVTGYFSATLDFDPGPDILEMTAENTDPFIWKLTDNAALVWAVQFEGVSFDQSRNVTSDAWGNIYSTGWFGEIVDFDPGPDVHYLTSAGNNDMDDGYIAKLDSNGHFIWAYSVGGIGNDIGSNSIVDPFGNVFIGGSFQGKAGFYPGSNSPDSLTSAGSFDAFLVRWRQCPETTGEISPFACGAYTSPSGNHVWNVTGDYLDTLTNVFGCDSILTIHLSVINLITEVTSIPNQSLTAVQEDAGYQWLDCDNGFAVIQDEINQSYSPAASGNYAVIVSDEGCVDTSECITLLIVSIENQSKAKEISIYPNPADDTWYIHFTEKEFEVSIDILDLWGRIVFSSSYQEVDHIPMQNSFPTGIYYVNVVSGHTHAVLKLIKY